MIYERIYGKNRTKINANSDDSLIESLRKGKKNANTT